MHKSKNLKSEYGSLILKVDMFGMDFNPRERELATILETKKVLNKHLFESHSKSTEPGGALIQIWHSAGPPYTLTGTGKELIAKYGKDKLEKGSFSFEGELEWYDKWPWKLLWPAIVSIVVTVVMNWVNALSIAPPKQSEVQKAPENPTELKDKLKKQELTKQE